MGGILTFCKLLLIFAVSILCLSVILDQTKQAWMKHHTHHIPTAIDMTIPSIQTESIPLIQMIQKTESDTISISQLSVPEISVSVPIVKLSKADEAATKRINPDGMEEFNPWASGRALRHYSNHSNVERTVILYHILSDMNPEHADNVKFYIHSLKLASMRLDKHPAIDKDEFLHLFFSVGEVDRRIGKGLLSQKYLGFHGSHQVKLVEIDAKKYKTGCGSHYMQKIRCAFNGISWKDYNNFVLLDSSYAGPFLPDYWSMTSYSMWSKAYTSLLSNDVRVVGTKLTCQSTRESRRSQINHVPYFRGGPIAFDNRVMEILASKGFAVDRMEFTYMVLLAGYNILAMHGQPKGHDWRRWLLREPGQCTPMTHPQQQCVWTDWKRRYPELAHLPLHEASELFLKHNPPEGDGCNFRCNYRKYRDFYGDLHRLSVRMAGEHFIKYGSVEGRVCELDPDNEYSVHPYESLFMPRNSANTSIATKNYLEWAKSKNQQALLTANVKFTKSLLRTVATTSGSYRSLSEAPVRKTLVQKGFGDRVLVVYAYYEKNEEYRSNLMYFLEMCVFADAMHEAARHIDYVIVVNGAYTVTFPDLPNLRVIYRDNSCLDFGSWGIGFQQRKSWYTYFFCINSSVKGPFLPVWFLEHWTEAFLSHLKGNTKLVGLSVNCPDGIGRAIPHVMSMAMAFDTTVLEIGLRKGIFDCAETYQIGLSRESDLSLAVIEAGYNIASMQTTYEGVDFKSWYERNKNLPYHGIYAGPDGYNRCNGIDLDIFFKEGWYRGMSPNPFEFVFYKVNRHVNVRTTELIAEISRGSARQALVSSNKFVMRKTSTNDGEGTIVIADKCRGCFHVAILMHSLNIDGAPRLLFDMGRYMIQMGHKVTFISFHHGDLEGPIKSIGGDLKFLSGPLPSVLDDILGELHLAADVVLVNTITWTKFIAGRPDLRPAVPKIAWIIHESELSKAHAIPPSNYWFGVEFPLLESEHRVRSLVHNVDNVVFVADKVRAIWSQHDTGHFQTFRGFVVSDDVKRRAREGIESKQALRASLGISPSTIVLTAVGTICQRKRQRLLAEALSDVGRDLFGQNDFMLLLIGAPSASGGKGDDIYYEGLKSFVESSNLLKPRVKFFPFANDALKYVAIADLHLSVSIGEAFPLNVLEAMVLRVPVMVTPAGGSEEAIMSPGEDGFLLPPVSSRIELGDNMLKLLNGRLHSLKQIGENGHSTVMHRYSEETAPARMNRLLNEIMVKPFAPKGRVCVVVRAYAVHMDDPVFSLQRMLQSLISQSYPHWTAYISTPELGSINGLYSLIAKLDDPRLRIADYPDHIKVSLDDLSITEKVIQQCPVDTDWLLITNGNDWYDPNFLDHLDLNKDLISYDYYSRYVHIMDEGLLGSGCDKFFKSNNVMCKRNQLRHNHTLLGANVINYKKWKIEGRSYRNLIRSTPHSPDGNIIESLVYYDWSVKLVGVDEGCLFSESPNMYSCLQTSEQAMWVESKHLCITDKTVQKALLEENYRVYQATSVPEGMEKFQGRCLDTTKKLGTSLLQ